jgi:hypothetical protein
MDYLDVCLNGTGCALSTTPGNRNLADFFEVTIDHTGAAEIVYDDMSNGLIQQPQPSTTIADHAGAPLVSVIRQNGGPGLLGTDVTGASSAPISGLDDPSGDALFPVIGGSNQAALDLTRSSLSLSGSTLTVTMKVANLNQLPTVPTVVPGTTLEEFVTRWQMGNTLYYAEASFANDSAAVQWSAGKVQSVDLCSVSLCLPRVLLYGEVPNPTAGVAAESGTVSCPGSPSGSNPCTITITVNTADVGSPNDASLLEEVGAYALTTSHTQSGTTNAQGQLDNVPLEVDGVCCYNFQANNLGTPIPETPWTPMLVGLGAALVTGGVITRRRHKARTTSTID